jgi:hypothetical protein
MNEHCAVVAQAPQRPSISIFVEWGLYLVTVQPCICSLEPEGLLFTSYVASSGVACLLFMCIDL